MNLNIKNISINLLIYGIAHGVVDLICAAIAFSLLKKQIINASIFFSMVILYNALAFGLQSFLGLVIDYFRSPRLAAILGCILTGVPCFFFLSYPWFSIVIVAIGNALFHVGGGSISLNLIPKQATAPGIFIAPGAVGLFMGILFGKNGAFVAWPFIIPLCVLSILMLIIKPPKMNYDKATNKVNYFEAILFLVLLSIAIRSFIGFAVVFPWKSNINLSIILISTIFLGKALGGAFGDRFGWRKIAVGALLLSIPFLTFGASIPYLAITGMFLFNLTTPITLTVISNILPGRPAFAFGLACLFLLFGALPNYYVISPIFGANWFIFIIILTSALVLYIGLNLYFKIYQARHK